LWTNIMILHQPYGERYAYLANIGAMLALGYALTLLPSLYQLAAFTFLLSYYCWRSLDYSNSYMNQWTYAVDNYRNFPDSSKAIFQLAVEESIKGSHSTSYFYYKKGLELYPNDFQSWFNIASLEGRIGKLEDALKSLDTAENLLWTIANEKSREIFRKHIQHNRTITYKMVEQEEAKRKKASMPKKEKPHAYLPQRKKHR